MEEISYVFSFSVFHCHSFSPCIWLVAASISYFVTSATKFWCCSSNKKMSPFFISRSRSLSPYFSLSFAGLPPTSSLSLCSSCCIFQICGKRESRRQASEAQREKGRQRSRARDKKQRRHFFVGRTTWKFCSGGDKMRNSSGHQCKVKMSGSENKWTRKRSTFLS